MHGGASEALPSCQSMTIAWSYVRPADMTRRRWNVITKWMPDRPDEVSSTWHAHSWRSCWVSTICANRRHSPLRVAFCIFWRRVELILSLASAETMYTGGKRRLVLTQIVKTGCNGLCWISLRGICDFIASDVEASVVILHFVSYISVLLNIAVWWNVTCYWALFSVKCTSCILLNICFLKSY
jgi:hypothetical protein